jgi:hypothetical protein
MVFAGQRFPSDLKGVYVGAQYFFNLKCVETTHGWSVIESAQTSGKIHMSDFKVGQHVTVKLSGGRLVDAEIKAIIETTDGIRL